MRTLEAPTVDTQVQELLKKIISQEREEAPCTTTTDTSFTTSDSLSASASLSLDRDRERKAGFPSPPHSMPASLQDLPLSNDPDLIYDRRVPSSRDRDHHRGDEEAELDEGEETSNRTPVQMPDPDVNEAIVLSQVIKNLISSKKLYTDLKNI